MITINNDEIYKLIRELKELRDLIPNDTKPNLMKRYKIKVKYQLLEQILEHGGFNEILAQTISSKNSLLLVEGVVEEEQNEMS